MTVLPVVLSAPDPVVRKTYDELVADLDNRISALITSRFPGKLQCRAGCASCCTRFSVSLIEAAVVAQARKGLEVSEGAGGENCGLLSGGRCSIYRARPIICRTQGLPLGYVDEQTGTIEVSACPLNFPEEYPLAFEDVLLMDEINQRLAAINLEYCLNAGLDSEQRIAVHECGDPVALERQKGE